MSEMFSHHFIKQYGPISCVNPYTFNATNCILTFMSTFIVCTHFASDFRNKCAMRELKYALRLIDFRIAGLSKETLFT